MADVNNHQGQQKQEENGGNFLFTNGHGHGNYFDQIKKKGATSDGDKMKDCLIRFDKDGDGYLNEEEFSEMLRSLFTKHGTSYSLKQKDIRNMFKLMDENQDGLIDEDEFQVIWYHWLKQILDPVAAFIMVDVQNDFISGTLAICNCEAGHHGEDVVPPINKLLDTCKFDTIVYSLDWHPADHISFAENILHRPIHSSSKVKADIAKVGHTVVFDGPHVTEQRLWPAHCVQGSQGSELHPELKFAEGAICVKKGMNSDVDSYSAFWDNMKLSKTDLEKELTSRGVTDVYVCGIAYDVCVGATAMHSLEHGFRTILVEDACRGVSEADIESTRQSLLKSGAIIVQSDEVPELLNANDRRPELGVKAAFNVALARRLVTQEKRTPSKK